MLGAGVTGVTGGRGPEGLVPFVGVLAEIVKPIAPAIRSRATIIQPGAKRRDELRLICTGPAFAGTVARGRDGICESWVLVEVARSGDIGTEGGRWSSGEEAWLRGVAGSALASLARGAAGIDSSRART
jgi:hypothetical protein